MRCNPPWCLLSLSAGGGVGARIVLCIQDKRVLWLKLGLRDRAGLGIHVYEMHSLDICLVPTMKALCVCAACLFVTHRPLAMSLL